MTRAAVAPVRGAALQRTTAESRTLFAVAPWTCALATAGLLALSARPWGPSPLAWVALAPVFGAALVARTWWQAAALTAVAATGTASVAYEPAAGIGPGWYLLAVALGAVPFGAAGALAWLLARKLPGSLGPLTVALFWTLAELLPAQPALLGAYALPLNVIGYTQADLPVVHLARLGSVTAVSLAVLLGNALLLQLWLGLARAWAVACLACLAGAACAAALTAPAPGTGERAIDVAVAQPNRPTALLAAAQRVPQVRQALLEEMATLAAPATAPGVDLLVWPEGSMPGVVLHDGEFAALDDRTLMTLAALPPSLLGAAGRSDDGTDSNSAFLWSGGRLHAFYDKVHLVPVAEAGLAPGTHVPLTPLAGVAAAPSICYDVLFPATVRAAAAAGAELLAVLTDDAFAARGDVPRQHLRVARVRAVETGLPVAFASNTGPSAILDGAGRAVAASAAGETALLRATLGTGASPTPYVRYGNWVGALVCLAVVVLTLAAARGAAGTDGGAPTSQRPT